MVDYTKVEHATIRNYRGEEKAKENSATGLAATLNMSLSSSHKYGCDLREGFFFFFKPDLYFFTPVQQFMG